MNVRRIIAPAIAAMALAVGLAPAPARAPGLVALAAIEPGQWQVHERGAGDRSICLSDPDMLLTLRHAGAQCTRVISENGGRVAAIHYSCVGGGQGRTTLTVETPRLVQIETNGVAGGAPFNASYEARRTGSCASATAAR